MNKIESIAKVCQELNDSYKLNPSELLDSARSEFSPIHNCFEWNDSIAAEAHRLRQAAQWIADVKIMHTSWTPKEVEDSKNRAWIPIVVNSPASKPEWEYQDSRRIKDDRDKAKEYLKRVESSILSMIETYDRYSRFFGINEYSQVVELAKSAVAHKKECA